MESAVVVNINQLTMHEVNMKKSDCFLAGALPKSKCATAISRHTAEKKMRQQKLDKL